MVKTLKSRQDGLALSAYGALDAVVSVRVVLGHWLSFYVKQDFKTFPIREQQYNLMRDSAELNRYK